MTPLTNFFSRYLPPWLVWPGVTMTYATMLAFLVLFGTPIGTDVIYIDLEAAE